MDDSRTQGRISLALAISAWVVALVPSLGNSFNITRSFEHFSVLGPRTSAQNFYHVLGFWIAVAALIFVLWACLTSRFKRIPIAGLVVAGIYCLTRLHLVL